MVRLERLAVGGAQVKRAPRLTRSSRLRLTSRAAPLDAFSAVDQCSPKAHSVWHACAFFMGAQSSQVQNHLLSASGRRALAERWSVWAERTGRAGAGWPSA